MNDDLISRQAVIDALVEYFNRIGKLKRRGLNQGEKAIRLDVIETVKTLPSAEQEPEEIIECSECVYSSYEPHEDLANVYVCKYNPGRYFDDYCSQAKRRTDE